ncbi:hotdog fold thioesterase [Arthrobacter rhombi]
MESTIELKVAIPHGPPEELFGLSSSGISPEGAFGSMALGPWAREADGRFAMGAMGVLVDNVLALAVLAHRPKDMWAVTTELAFDFFATPAPEGRLTASGRALTSDAGGGGSTGHVVDDDGTVVATATFWGRYIEGVPQAIIDQRRAPSLDSRAGSIGELLGLSGDRDRRVLPERVDTVNPLGVIHGGVLVPAFERAAVDGGARPDGMSTASIRVSYLRPASGDIHFSVKQLHRGRTFASAEVTASRCDGKASAWALLTFRSPER